MRSMTYGTMPSRPAFDRAFDRECPDGTFSFGNDERFGTCSVGADALWDELTVALGEFESDATTDEHGEGNPNVDGDKAGDWCSCVLSCLGFEWI